jgi:hypothetical protein
MSTLNSLPLPLPLRITQAIGLTGTSLLAGLSLTLSFVSIPRILESPAPLLLRQWTHLFNQLKILVPSMATLCGSSLIYLAYLTRTSQITSWNNGMGYLAAGTATVSIVPWTMVFMLRTNTKLLEMTERAEGMGKGVKGNWEGEISAKGSEESAHQLVDQWAVLNLGRAALFTFGAVTAIWSALN